MDLSRIINDDNPVPQPFPRKMLQPELSNRKPSPPPPASKLASLDPPKPVVNDHTQPVPLDHVKPEPTDRIKSEPTDQIKPEPTERVKPELNNHVKPTKPQRRQKFDSPPIWARKAQVRKHIEREPPRRDFSVKRDMSVAGPPRAVVPKPEIARLNVPEAEIPRLKASSETLGKWELSILNVVPHEEFTRVVADYLYPYVVGHNDLGSENIEIEAKIGQLMDQNRQQRVYLPVHTETIIRKDDPKLRTTFQSSMTLAQHSAFNQYLNAALLASLQKKDEPVAPNARVPLTYVHTREVDTMYELTQAAELALPASMRKMLTPRFKRVRVTTDQKTGNVITKMIKVRLADLDVYSPMTPFDWRISVNLEAPYQGEHHDLPPLMEKGKKPPPRNKDRLTYRHLAYQIDLTQVTIAEEGFGEEKEHELEIELDSTIIHTQAELLRNGQPNGYEDVIRGFVDNVRLLIRSSKR